MNDHALLSQDRDLQLRERLILDSREAILALSPMLEAFADRCGQPGAMHWLPYFLDRAVLGQRAPRLVLLLRPEEDEGRGLCVEDLRGAALFFEYEVLGLRTGAVATGDAVGFSSVIAPPGERAHVAEVAARTLMNAGASVVLATFEGYAMPHSGSAFAELSGVTVARRQRRVERALRLLPTLEETLAQMGKSTRANLRRYRRRLEAQVRCEFVPEAAAALVGADLDAINRASLNPVPLVEFQRRVHASSHLPGSFLCGLRAVDGGWLALMGGWRQGRTTVLQWQMNSAGFEKLSIGTAMRSYLLEREIELGAEKLMLYGGTPHAMRHAFEEQPLADLVVRRKGFRGAAICLASRLFAGPNRMASRGNFLAATLQDRELRWISIGPAPKPQRAPLLRPAQSETVA